MAAQDNIDVIANKIFAMNEKLDQLIQLAHHLEVQNAAMVSDDSAESDIDKILTTPATRNLPMLTSTPSRSQSLKKVTDWKSLSPAEQLEVLHEVANTHTKVSLDFEGLRRSIVAAQKASALQEFFNLLRDPEDDKSNEEEEFIISLMDDNVDMTKRLSTLMEDYMMAEVEASKQKTVLAAKWIELRRFYAMHFGDENNENDASASNTTATKSSVVDKKKATLKLEEKKCEQMKVLTQKLMMSFPNLNLDSVPLEDVSRFRDSFSRCGKSLQQLKEEKQS